MRQKKVSYSTFLKMRLLYLQGFSSILSKMYCTGYISLKMQFVLCGSWFVSMQLHLLFNYSSLLKKSARWSEDKINLSHHPTTPSPPPPYWGAKNQGRLKIFCTIRLQAPSSPPNTASIKSLGYLTLSLKLQPMQSCSSEFGQGWKKAWKYCWSQHLYIYRYWIGSIGFGTLTYFKLELRKKL
jgi:hypothetical protein